MVTTTDMHVIMSPTEIRKAGWPGADESVPAGATINQSLPRANDYVIVQGRQRQVKNANCIYVGGYLTRIELMASG